MRANPHFDKRSLSVIGEIIHLIRVFVLEAYIT
jgi:hypothetical protein